MLEMHLRQTEFTYSACGTFTKERIYQSELDKACF